MMLKSQLMTLLELEFSTQMSVQWVRKIEKINVKKKLKYVCMYVCVAAKSQEQTEGSQENSLANFREG